MKIFVSMVIVVLLFTLFAIENTATVPMRLMTFLVEVPLAIAIIMPLGIALLFFSLFHFGTMNRAELVIHDLEDNVENAQKQLLEVTKRAHELEIENRKLKIRLGEDTEVDDLSL